MKPGETEAGFIDIVAVAGKPFKLTCWELNEIVYPEITKGDRERLTVLGI